MSNIRIIKILLLVASMSAASIVIADDDKFSTNVDSDGRISLPVDFRNNMSHLGSWFVPEGGASGFHDVYAEKEAVEYYRKNGVFPDGTTVVKELRAATAGDYTTGSGVSYANGQLKQWFVMVKDNKNRFDGNANWGNGWGWALFKTDDKSVNASSDYQKDCLGCHVPAKESDWLYVEAYPTLSSE